MNKDSYILIIGIFSFLLLSIAFKTYLHTPGDAYLLILMLACVHVILGLIRILTALKTDLPVLFRIQDFCYSILTVIPIFVPLTHKPEMLLGQAITFICLISTAYWTYYFLRKKVQYQTHVK